MEKLLSVLKTVPEFHTLLESLRCNESAAVTGIGQINRNPRLLAEAQAFCQEKYGYDGCVIDIDDASLAEACGAKVIYREYAVAPVDIFNSDFLEDVK